MNINDSKYIATSSDVQSDIDHILNQINNHASKLSELQAKLPRPGAPRHHAQPQLGLNSNLAYQPHPPHLQQHIYHNPTTTQHHLVHQHIEQAPPTHPTTAALKFAGAPLPPNNLPLAPTTLPKQPINAANNTTRSKLRIPSAIPQPPPVQQQQHQAASITTTAVLPLVQPLPPPQHSPAPPLPPPSLSQASTDQQTIKKLLKQRIQAARTSMSHRTNYHPILADGTVVVTVVNSSMANGSSFCLLTAQVLFPYLTDTLCKSSVVVEVISGDGKEAVVYGGRLNGSAGRVFLRSKAMVDGEGLAVHDKISFKYAGFKGGLPAVTARIDRASVPQSLLHATAAAAQQADITKTLKQGTIRKAKRNSEQQHQQHQPAAVDGSEPASQQERRSSRRAKRGSNSLEDLDDSKIDEMLVLENNEVKKSSQLTTTLSRTTSTVAVHLPMFAPQQQQQQQLQQPVLYQHATATVHHNIVHPTPLSAILGEVFTILEAAGFAYGDIAKFQAAVFELSPPVQSTLMEALRAAAVIGNAVVVTLVSYCLNNSPPS